MDKYEIGFTRESTFVLNCGEVYFIHNGYEEAKELWNRRESDENARGDQEGAGVLLPSMPEPPKEEA